MTTIHFERISYGGWDRCLRLTNNIIDVIVTADVGPRIIRYGFVGQKNILCEVVSTLGATGGGEWKLYGGHRLWHSPEDAKRTYEPDNDPVSWAEIPNGVKVIQDKEPGSLIKKEMEITLAQETTGVNVLHRLTNHGSWPVTLSVWSITAMAPGGKEVIPYSGRDTGLLPNRLIVIWPYTRLNDPRLYFGNKYIALQHDVRTKHPVKIGTINENGWAGYFNDNTLFIKSYIHHMNLPYPDHGVSYETYANNVMLEMETLSPLHLLGPRESAEHVEQWQLSGDIPAPVNGEDDIDRALSKQRDMQ